jgi:glycosyltransferase involved in cell wall biosynthesis
MSKAAATTPRLDDGTREAPLVSIVAPVFNEEDVIAEFVRRTVAAIAPLDGRYRFELILVDDGSRDRSLERMRGCARDEPRLRVIELERNYGQSQALQAGIDAARGGILITLDADLQHFPEEIPAFLAKLEEGFDIVCGWRHARAEGVMRRAPSKMANRLIRWATGLEIHDVGTTFRAYRADIAKQIRLLGEQHRFVPALAASLGARITELPIENIVRRTGKSSYGLGRTTGVFLDIVFLRFIFRYLDRPIRLFGRIALLFFLAAAALAAVVVAFPLVLGWGALEANSATILALIIIGVSLSLAGVQMLLTGVISEVIVRIHFAQDDRRLYHVRREWRRDNLSP